MVALNPYICADADQLHTLSTLDPFILNLNPFKHSISLSHSTLSTSNLQSRITLSDSIW
ncbi:hypothetical protein PGTUg99_004392 [Puccinia graminis f. sp. tritici]|uniref:Uncharacterized protein n=1 Tax=Puccinia graminis f. sp. tritici TaxID=56615 RepID=A0A5B0M308_PUCGR|nr:hypothetical protein PGTUg99_004392 [Puccinia graminis f. sp. tritici]